VHYCAVRVETWADVAALLSKRLSTEDEAGGWTDALREHWAMEVRQYGGVGSRFLPYDAGALVRALKRDGVTSGPIVDALLVASGGIPGVADPKAVALAVKLAAARVRRLGFTGSTPHLERGLPDGTVHLVNFQRANSGVTGREPGFTVNLNVVPAATRQACEAAGDRKANGPLRSGADVGVWTRLGTLAYGEDFWWRPPDEAAAKSAADEVADLMERVGLPWLARITDHSTR
jgi:hypothetical protein